MNWEERYPIMKALKPVDEVIMITDCLNSYQDALRQVRRTYPSSTLVFTSGNPPCADNTPLLSDQDVRFEHNVGCDVKRISSSAILRRHAEYIKSIREMESSPFRRYD